MSLQEDLHRALLSVDGPQSQSSYAVASDMAVDFLRDHGQALLDALEDAERYRWLRASDTPTAEFCLALNEYGDFQFMEGRQLDQAIDAAIKGDG